MGKEQEGHQHIRWVELIGYFVDGGQEVGCCEREMERKKKKAMMLVKESHWKWEFRNCRLRCSQK